MTFKHFFNDPVTLTLKAKSLAAIVGFLAILAVANLTALTQHSPILIASMGASTVLLFLVPTSPLSQPWQLLGGQVLSALVGVLCANVIPETALAAACAVGLSILIMLLARCLHPPGAATALAPVLSQVTDYSFIVLPVAVNVLLLFGVAVVLNRYVLKNNYPLMPKQETEQDTRLKQLLNDTNRFMDVSLDDLNQLLMLAEKHRLKQRKPNMTCGDIMLTDIFTVEYGTEVEEAWQIMLTHKLKAMPVLDKSSRVIGIITWADFFKFVDLNSQKTFQEKFLAFIRRTPDVQTNKPEAVGHIMTQNVLTVEETTHIVELIPLMSQQDIRQIPIVNRERRLVGMVYQTHLIAALS